MTNLNFKVYDNKKKVSPLCENQLDPTDLPLVHPDKHVAPKNKHDIKDYPFSLFLDINQRNDFIAAISSNNIFCAILIKEIEQRGDQFRVFADIQVEYLNKNLSSCTYWFYDTDTKMHIKRAIDWVGICLDVIVDSATDKVNVSVHTIFPLATEHKMLSNLQEYKDQYYEVLAMVELLRRSYTEKYALYNDGREQTKLAARWYHSEATHGIFQTRQVLFGESGRLVVSSFLQIPYVHASLPDCNKLWQTVKNQSTRLELHCTQLTVYNSLIDIGFSTDDASTWSDKLNTLHTFLDDDQTNRAEYLLKLKQEIPTVSCLKEKFRSLAIKVIAQKYFPKVERYDLITLYAELKRKADNNNETFSISWKGILLSGKYNKNIKKSIDSLLHELNQQAIPDERIMGKAINLLYRYITIDGVAISHNPILTSVSRFIDQKKELLQQLLTKLEHYQTVTENLVDITAAIERNKEIEQRNFDEPLQEIESQLNSLLNSHESTDEDIMLLLQRHFADTDRYAVTTALDAQINIFAHSLKEAFGKQLSILLKQIVTDHNAQKITDFIGALGLENPELFFRPNPKNVQLFVVNFSFARFYTDKTFDDFCNIVAATRSLITATNNYLISHLYDDLTLKPIYINKLKNLSQSIQDFYNFRQCHPYVYSPFFNKEFRVPSPDLKKPFFTLLLEGLKQRLICERDYSRVLGKHSEKVKVLTAFVNESGKYYFPLNSIKKILKVMKMQSEQPLLTHATPNSSAFVMLSLHSNSNTNHKQNDGLEEVASNFCQ